MSILDIREDDIEKKSFIGMLIGTVFCIVFAVIYNRFGHGITSKYMDFMFLIPLVFGTTVYGVLIHFGEKIKSRTAARTYNLGIITLTIGSMLKGIFHIAGTDSPYVKLYWMIGSIMLLTGALFGFMLKGKR